MELHREVSDDGAIIQLRFRASNGSPDQFRSTVKLIERQLGDGISSTLEDHTLQWKQANLSKITIELKPEEAGVELSIHEDSSQMLRGARWSGLGIGFALTLLIFLMPLAIPIGFVIASMGISNSLDDAANIALILKAILSAFVTLRANRQRRNAVVNGLKHRRAELETLAKRCVKNLVQAS